MKMKSKKLNKFRILFERNKRFRAISIVFFAIIGVALFAMLSFFMIRLESAKKVTAAISVEPETLDPTFCDNIETETVIANCFEGLMRIDANGEAVKAAASDYTVSEDGLVYTFTIDTYSMWSDGTAVEASDFVYSWRRTANPYNSSQYAYLFENIVGYDKILADFEREQNGEKDEEGNYITANMSDLWVKSVDSRTLAVKLKQRDPSFLKKCAMVPFMPLCEDKVKPNTRIWSTDKKTFVSNGAFKLSEWMGGNYLTLEPNTNFRDKEKVSLESLKFYFVSDGEEALSRFNKSSVLYSSVLPEDKKEKTARKKEYVSYETLGSYFLYFNLSIHPFDDLRVREALTLAIDREELIEKTATVNGVAASGIISDGFSSFRQNGESYFDVTNNKNNIEKAKQLLKAAGYENGKNFPKFEYLFNDNTYSRKTAEILKEMWKENLGIECELKSVSWSKLDEMRQSRNFSVAKGGIMVPYNDVVYVLNQFASENNFSSWKNEEYDSLVQQMIKTTADKNNLAHKAEKILADNFVVCPLYYYADGYLASPRIKNYYVTDSGVAYFVYSQVNVF